MWNFIKIYWNKPLYAKIIHVFKQIAEIHTKMARSSHSKGSVSVDLFNLPTLPDERRVATSYLDIPVDFYLPDGKNSKISKIVSRQAFDRQTPDGNEGFVIEIQYLERAFGTNTYLIDKVTGSLFALHDDHIKSHRTLW